MIGVSTPDVCLNPVRQDLFSGTDNQDGLKLAVADRVCRAGWRS